MPVTVIYIIGSIFILFLIIGLIILKTKLKKSKIALSKIEAEYDHHKKNLSSLLESNLTSMPWLAGMMADFATYDLELEERKRIWARKYKAVDSIREIREETKKELKKLKLQFISSNIFAR